MIKLNKKITFTFIVLLMVALISLMSLQSFKGVASVYLGNDRKLPIYSVNRDDNKIAISFDCAYGDEYTLEILDTLDEYGVKCTFFAVEFWVNKFSDKVIEIDKRGHEIGTHSKTHPKMSTLSKSQMESELTSSISAIEKLTNKKVELFRAPFGDYNNSLIEVATSLNLYTIQWDVDSLDWKNLSSDEIAYRILSKTKSGSIILCHNNGLHTAEALKTLLPKLQEKGFEFLPISKLIYKDKYQINSNGVQSQTK